MLGHDVRYSLRSLQRDPGFTVFAVAIASLGIAASTTIVSVVSALLMRDLPVRDGAQLVWIQAAGGTQAGDLSAETLKVNPFLEFRQATRSFVDVAAYFAFYENGGLRLTGTGEPDRLTGVPVSQNFFALLGVAPLLGRSFSDDEARANLPVAVLDEGVWRRRFAADPAVVGRAFTLNGRSTTIIGVVPFDFGSVLAPGTRVDVYLPLPLTDEVNRMGNTLSAIGRLEPGTTLAQAQAEANVLSEPIGARHDRDGLRFTMRALEERVRGPMRPALLLLACAVGVVMLIVCTNLSNLQLARSSARQREFAIRVAIRVAVGASRGRLVCQLLTESLLLTSGAAVVALGLTSAATTWLAGLEAINVPLRGHIRLDPVAFLASLAVATVTGLVLGLAPTVQMPSQPVHDALENSTRGSSAGRSSSRVRATLVVAQLAFACVLLVGAGLLIRSLLRLTDAPLGFRPDHALAVRIEPRTLEGDAHDAYIDEVLRLARAVPGASAVGITDVLPLGGNRNWSAMATDQIGRYSKSRPPPEAFVRIVSDGYFEAMGIELRTGRVLEARDRADSRAVIVINDTLARTLFPGQVAVGKILRADVDREVVGVVGGVRHIALEQQPGAEMYVPIRQTRDFSGVHVVVRTSTAVAMVAAGLVQALRSIDPTIPPGGFQALDQLVDRSLSPRRFVVALLACFAAFALVLATLGVYSVVAYAVRQQTQDRTLLLAGAGIATGVGLSLVLARTATTLLYGVEAHDPATYVVVTLVLVAAALVAGVVPARQASNLDPTAALRLG